MWHDTDMNSSLNYHNRKRKYRPGWAIALLIGGAGLVLGAGTGAGIAVATQPEPTREVIEIEREVEVPVTPPECMEALASATELLGWTDVQSITGNKPVRVYALETELSDNREACMEASRN